MVNLGIDFAMGAGATLAVEFVIAHAWLWYQGGGSNTVSGTLGTIETDLSKVKTGVVNLEQKVVSGVKGAANAVVTDVRGVESRTDQFFNSWFHSNTTPAVTPTAQTAPVVQAAPVVAQTAPQTSGTPVPSVVLSAPA